jgi:hypothetical protein
MDRVAETEVHGCGDGKARGLVAELILSTAVKEPMRQEVPILSQALKGSQS